MIIGPSCTYHIVVLPRSTNKQCLKGLYEASPPCDISQKMMWPVYKEGFAYHIEDGNLLLGIVNKHHAKSSTAMTRATSMNHVIENYSVLDA